MASHNKYDVSVLLVEDEGASRLYAAALLKTVVEKVETAENGAIGLEKFETFVPDFVISDIGMPLMNGLEMVREIRQRSPETPIVFTTALDQKEYLIEAINLGVDRYIVKPVDSEQLIAAVSKVAQALLLEKEVAAQRERIKMLSQAVEQNPGGAVILDSEGKADYANNAFLNFFDLQRDELIGRKIEEIVLDKIETARGDVLIRELISAGRKAKGEITFPRSDGSLGQALAGFSGIENESGEASNYIITIDDITDLKKAEEKIKLANRILEKRVRERTAELEVTNEKLREEIEFRNKTELELIKAKELAEAANKAKDSFLAKVSHELRTPMNGIIGISSVLLNSSLDDKQKRFVEMIKISGDNLLKIINDILDYSKVAAGKLVLISEDFDIFDVIEETVEFLSYEARKKGLELAYEIDPAIPKYYTGDSRRFREILINLIGNAIKFTPEGHVKLRAKAKEITDNHAVLEFIVEDTGIGIPDDKIDRLFKGFSQIDNSFTRKFGGTGLGLAITKELVELMGGGIRVESVRGEGTQFIFNLKFERSDASSSGKPKNYKEKIRETQSKINRIGNDLVILIADDSDINREVLVNALERPDWKIYQAADGREAVELYRLDPPDIIFMDVQMPVIDGLKATRIIRRDESDRPRKTPIVGLTAHGFDSHEKVCLQAGMDAFIVKPYDWDQIYRIIRENVPERSEALKKPANVAGLKAAMKNNPEKVDALIRYFLKNFPKEITELEELTAAKDLQKTENLAHKIKSEAGNFAAVRLTEIAGEIEKFARAGEDDEIGNQIHILKKEFAKVASYFEKELPKLIGEAK